MIELARDRDGLILSHSSAVLVGDKIESDIASAKAAGIGSILVFTGAKSNPICSCNSKTSQRAWAKGLFHHELI
jgi:ribonucleotide monophosphatase NagD (HAD superfamily)